MMSDLGDLITRPVSTAGGQDFATEVLSGATKSGSLLLLIGAGVSTSTTQKSARSASFPSWGTLLADFNSIRLKLAVEKDLLKWADEIETEYKARGERELFVQDLKKAVYKNAPGYDVLEINRELLFSICALISRSRARVPIYIVNFNYDDILEWFLYKFGFKVRVVTSLPSLIEACDVVSIHPHGFLPNSAEFRRYEDGNIVLSGKSYRKVGRGQEWYHEFLRVLVGQSVSLYLGLSGEDPHILAVFEEVFGSSALARLMGYRLVKGSGDDYSAKVLSQAGVASVFFESYEDIPEFLYKVARRA